MESQSIRLHAVLTAERSTTAQTESTTARFIRRGGLFLAIGLLLYLGVYVFADQLVYGHTLRNRFFVVKTAPLPHYDMVVLGASHAAVFDYEDMNARLESLTGAHVINLSVVGSGVTPNKLLLDYLLVNHSVGSVIYVLDSFVFDSPQWNEQRLSDAHLYDRAPFDPALALLLAKTPATRAELSDYVFGFSKINNQDRFNIDVSDDEAQRFGSTYRPVPQIDTQRLKFLYPNGVDEASLNRYLGEFDDLLQALDARHIRISVIKPPLPERLYRQLPAEAQFDARLVAIVGGHSAQFHDFSLMCNDERFFFNPDHLNRAGVLNFYASCLPALLGSSG